MKAKVTYPRNLSFEFCVATTTELQQKLWSYAGASRFAYNQCWALVTEALARRRSGENISAPRSAEDFINAFNTWKKSSAAGVSEDGTVGLSWQHQVLSQVFEESTVDFSRALNRFYQFRTGKVSGPKVGFPKKKKKFRDTPRFRIRNMVKKTGWNSMRFSNKNPRVLVVPGLGEICLKQDTRRVRQLIKAVNGVPRGRIWFATFRFEAGAWYVRLQLGAQELHAALRLPKEKFSRVVGGDVGLKTLITVADTHSVLIESVAPTKRLRCKKRKLKKLARSMTRKRREAKKNNVEFRSQRYTEARILFARCHAKIARQREHESHCLSKKFAKNHDVFALETLGIRGLMKNHCHAFAIADAGWGILKRHLSYKLRWHGGKLIEVGRFFPSSKLCSSCHWKNDALTLKDRTFGCLQCGLIMDRDLNAAINIAREGQRLVAEQAKSINGCGEERSGARRKLGAKRASAKQQVAKASLPRRDAVDYVNRL